MQFENTTNAGAMQAENDFAEPTELRCEICNKLVAAAAADTEQSDWCDCHGENVESPIARGEADTDIGQYRRAIADIAELVAVGKWQSPSAAEYMGLLDAELAADDDTVLSQLRAQRWAADDAVELLSLCHEALCLCECNRAAALRWWAANGSPLRSDPRELHSLQRMVVTFGEREDMDEGDADVAISEGDAAAVGGALPKAWASHAVGLIAELVEHNARTAPYPNAAAAMMGGIALQSTLCGRKVRTESDARPNLYAVALGASASGKEAPRATNKMALSGVGLADCLGDAVGSGEGIEDHVLTSPTALLQIDECDTLLAAVNAKDGKKASVAAMLLTLWGESSSCHIQRVRALPPHRGKKDAAEYRRQTVNQPSLSAFMTAIPQHFVDSLDEKQLTNGLAGRLLVAQCGERGRGNPNATVADIPQHIMERCKAWSEVSFGAGNLADDCPTPHVVGADDDARELLSDFRSHCDNAYHRSDNEGERALIGRAHEKAVKLSLIFATARYGGGDIAELRITGVDAFQAIRLSWYGVRLMVTMAAKVGESETDKLAAKLVEFVAKYTDAPHHKHSLSLPNSDGVACVFVRRSAAMKGIRGLTAAVMRDVEATAIQRGELAKVAAMDGTQLLCIPTKANASIRYLAKQTVNEARKAENAEL